MSSLSLAFLAGIVGAICIFGAVVMVLFELATRRGADVAARTPAHTHEKRRRPVRPLRLVRGTAVEDDAPPAAVSPRRWPRALRAVSLAIVTPLLEKNVLKTLSLDVPVIFSMSRVVVLGFAVAVLRQIWRAGIAGWPDATLAIAVVLALPILGTLDRFAPEQVVELTKALIGRFGTGGVRGGGNVHRTDADEPSRRDDRANG